MRSSLLAILLLAGPIAAQQPDAELAAVLRDWYRAAESLKDLACAVEHQTLDKALGVLTTSKGLVLLTRDGNRVRLNFESKSIDGSVAQRHIATETHLYEYLPAAKTVRVHALPTQYFKSIPFFAFVADKKLAQGRYEMKSETPQAPDKYYRYLIVRPRNAVDRAEFSEARISIARSNNLPAQIWVLLPNRTEVTWDFKTVQINPGVPANFFRDPDVKGWRVERIPAAK